MNALSSQNLSMKLCKIQIALGFARNMIFFFFNFFYSFFDDQLKVETQNIFDPLKKGKKKTGSSSVGTSKNNFICELKFVSININSIRGKKLELLTFLDCHQSHVVAI